MTTLTAPSHSTSDEQHLVLRGLSWDQYLSISDALPDNPGLRLTYLDGSLTFLTVSLNHDWLSRTFYLLIVAVANGCGVLWEPAGSTTYRRQDKLAGVEGDETYYFGPHAEVMRGRKTIDLSTQPPPDLAIEIEVTHPADDAMVVWGRLGVPEVWRFDADAETVSFRLRSEDGSYSPAERSQALPALTPADVNGQIHLAGELGSGRWSAHLGEWVRVVLLPRTQEGA